MDKRPPKKPMMKPSVIDARRLALNALMDVTRADAYATLALDKHLSRSNLSHVDKRLATNIFYSALENRIRISHVLGQFVSKMPEPVIEDILHIAAAQLLFMDKLPDHAVVDQAVRQVKTLGREHYAALVNGTLRSLIRARDAGEIEYPDKEKYPLRYLSIMHSLPEPLVKRIADDYGMDQAQEILRYRPESFDQTIRPNFRRYDAQAFEAYAEKRHWTLKPGVVPMAYHLSGAADLGQDEDFLAGRYSMIGESSMLAAYAVAPKGSEVILDACAAPGGKAAMMAEMLTDGGRVQAWDVHEHRVQLLKSVQKRLHLENMKPAVRDASIHSPNLDMMFDAVLIDAPCSGLGVMLNKPDIKYRVSSQDIDSLVKLQKKILDACCQYVGIGGRLIYSTCTITKDENERQVRAFLDSHPEFSLDESGDWLPESLRDRMQDGMLQLQPHLDHMDGFFIARMVRRGAL